jgi:hypothetical protein
MILYASSPDGIAQQQQAYDQYYLGANQNNAARYDAAQSRALQATLSQQQQDAAASQSDSQFNSEMAFKGSQSALDRASREKDVATQYAGARADRTLQLDDHDFQQAQSLAEKGLLPQTEDQLAAQYPNFKPTQIKVLANASSQHAFDKFATTLDQSIRNGIPLPVDAIPKIVDPKSPLYQQAIDYRSSKLAPFVAEYNSGQEKVRKGNLAMKIQSDISAPPLDTNVSPLQKWNPVSWAATVGHNLFAPSAAPDPVQPAGDWQQRAPQIVTALKSGADPAVTVDASTGRFANTMTNPNGQPSPAPIIAPVAAPAIDPNVLIGQAKLAIARGANPVAVKQRLLQQYNIQL